MKYQIYRDFLSFFSTNTATFDVSKALELTISYKMVPLLLVTTCNDLEFVVPRYYDVRIFIYIYIYTRATLTRMMLVREISRHANRYNPNNIMYIMYIVYMYICIIDGQMICILLRWNLI